MYTIAPRVGSRCQYVCASCLNATIRRGENASPRLLRQSSTVAAATHNAENESPKAESTGPRSLDSWLQKAAKKSPGSAQADQADKIATPLKPITKGRSKSALADKAHETAVTLGPSSSGKGAQTITKKRSKGGRVDPEDQTAEPLQTSSSNKGLPGTDGKPPPSASKKRRRKKRRQALNDISPPSSSDIGSSGAKGGISLARLVPSTTRKVFRTRQSPTVRISWTQSSHPVTRRVLSSVPIRPARTPHVTRVPGRQTKRRGQLLTYLYSITSSSANRVAKRVLMKVLEEKKLLTKRGLKIAQGDGDIFKDAAREELEKADKTLATTLLSTYENLESALENSRPEATDAVFKPLKEGEGYSSGSVHAQALKLVPVEKPQPPVPGLVCGLERVLFNQGVYRLRDPHTRIYNFDPYLESITPVKEFDYNALKEYITSSRDKTLIDTAVAEGSKYTGSTSSMTSALAHFHYLLSKWRPVNHDQLSRGFPSPLNSFTAIQRAPASIFLRRRDGVYAIDANKGFDTSNVLQWLGKSMEKFLTSDKEEYIKYRKENSHALTDNDKNSPESYHYTTFGDFLMRSQLDAHDPRLPGTGMYDLKTRAVISIRRDATDYEEGLGYEITNRYGEYDSYEREFYDMSRSAFLKYSLQVRMGRMDGIFVAFHNTERIFGFQYLPLPEIDQSLHGSTNTTLGDFEFKVSLELLNKVLDRATEKFPGEPLEVQFETRPKNATNGDCFMYIFARPVAEEDIQGIQEANIKQIQEYERRVIGLDADGQEAVLRAAIKDAAEAVNADDQNEILEAAFNHLDESASVETIRNAFGKVEKGTPVEMAVNKMLDLMAARAEREDAEAMASDANEAVAESSGENADTAAADEAPDWNAPIENDVESFVGRLAVFKLNIRNFVNGHEVVRPDNLNATHNWEVKYSLEEMAGKIETLYAASVRRRKESLGKSDVSSYMSERYGNIQDNVSRGKEYRKEMDRLDEEHGVKVYDKQEFWDFESLEKREENVRKDIQEEVEELKSLKEGKEQAVKV
ncbi:hypothetical protein VC83_00342 [Pseudogymnoascus destructans]|uniref:Uncharacterized protein n=2 Tax=Pseudogymnoascus destructans TaxID=655981 RepID=L8G7D0_PSED2|nr:uncharacterized protein VC83_00342 [Pseudogymnoascus destructans]ELR08774.1 hypothetical protein GMDG_03452 [Pseudogymnoascus destructans 20631-21]OAF63466.1 hypothetical protein VC83_00342 [Pseudogymnoascus destructans]